VPSFDSPECFAAEEFSSRHVTSGTFIGRNP
jgi:hypothetical protein